MLQSSSGLVTNLSSENTTECSSRHQGPDDDWSIQSKRRQVIFQAQQITFLSEHLQKLVDMSESSLMGVGLVATVSCPGQSPSLQWVWSGCTHLSTS